MSRLRVALGEYDTGWHDPAGSLDRAAELVDRAAGTGADLVVLPEMCTTGFTMDSAGRCERLDGPSVTRLREIARDRGVHLLAGVATRERVAIGPAGAGEERYFNSALLIDRGGDIAAHYRKRRLFVYAQEQRYYSAGERVVEAEVEGVRLGLSICFDLRYPELFREMAPTVDALLLIASWPEARRPHWDALTRARAIENQCYFVAVNRTGEGGGIAYDGGSVAYDPWGERLGGGGDIVTIDPQRVSEVRSRYPFVEDLRPAATAG